MISEILIDNPVTGKQESLTQAEFNSYMAQTNGAVLRWIVASDGVLKHATHDQKTHGSWASGLNPDVASKIVQFTREWGGLSINMKDGSMPTRGYMVAKPPEYGAIVDEADFNDPVKGPKILADYMKTHREDLGSGKNYLGTWLNEGKVYLDVSENIPDTKQAQALGRERNQKSIWDVVNQKEIDTGGTGLVEKESQSSRVARHLEDDRRTDRGIRETDSQQTNPVLIRFAPNLKPVLKHEEHDQSSHGSWATGNFDEETEYDSARDTYSERYGITNTGTRVGMTEAEHRAIYDYSKNGYRRINQFLRGSTKDSDLDKYDAIAIVLDNERMNEVAIEEWKVKNEVADDYEMSASDLEEAAYQYAFSGKHAKEVLAVYFEGKSPRGAIIKNDVEALDSLIDKSPSLFGDKTLYRVYSNNTLSNLQEGDIVTDKGFLSTTRIDVTQESQSETRSWMGDLNDTPDTVGIILPNESKSGKGLAVDIYLTVVDDTSDTHHDIEKEILLPRNTPLKFIGYKTDVGMEARVAIFQRMDK